MCMYICTYTCKYGCIAVYIYIYIISIASLVSIYLGHSCDRGRRIFWMVYGEPEMLGDKRLQTPHGSHSVINAKKMEK